MGDLYMYLICLTSGDSMIVFNYNYRATYSCSTFNPRLFLHIPSPSLNNLRSVPRGSTRHIVTPRLSTSKFRCSSSKNSLLSVSISSRFLTRDGSEGKKREERGRGKEEEKEKDKYLPSAHTVFLYVCGFL
jgi:hypothetical protein